MSFPVLLTDDAAHDLEDLCDYIDRHDVPGQADYVLEQLEKAFNSLSEKPHRGAYNAKGGMRFAFPLRGTGYRLQIYNNSRRSSRPTSAAARCSVSMVTLPFALRILSTWARLVCIRSAICVLVMPCWRISSAICQVITRITAAAFAAS